MVRSNLVSLRYYRHTMEKESVVYANEESNILLHVENTDITKIGVDVVVNAANCNLKNMGGKCCLVRLY